MINDQDVLYQGERLLWAGAPARRPKLDGVDFTVIGLCVFYLAFTAMWQTMAWSAPLFFRLFGAVIPLVILGLMIIPNLRRRSIAKRYLVTDRRIVVLSGTSKTASTYLRDLAPPDLLARDSSGIGTIRFGNTSAFSQVFGWLNAMRLGWRGAGAAITLIEIPDARTVREIIAGAQAHAPR